MASAAVILSALWAKSSTTVTPRALPTVWKRRPTPWKRAKRRDHVGKRHVERAAGGDGRKRIGDIVPAGHRQAEANLLDLKAASRGPELDVLAANIGARPEAEAERAAGKRIEILVLADHEGLARARAQHGEHLRHLGHLLVVALKIEDHADGGRVAHQRAVALIGLDDEEV